MIVTIGKFGGFCEGVKRAIERAKNTPSACVLGDLVNNDKVVERLEKVGVKRVEKLEELSSFTPVIGASGVTKKELAYISRYPFVDATCPRVKKCIDLSVEANDSSSTLLIVGDKLHKEVVNVASYCEKVKYVFSREEAENFTFDEREKYAVIFQTTLPENKAKEWGKILRKKAKNAVFYDTLCSAVKRRILEGEEEAKNYDAVVVVGAKKSANCRFLYSSIKEVNDNTYFVSGKEDIPEDLIGERVFVTGGASVDPKDIEDTALALAEKYGGEAVRKP